MIPASVLVKKRCQRHATSCPHSEQSLPSTPPSLGDASISLAPALHPTLPETHLPSRHPRASVLATTLLRTQRGLRGRGVFAGSNAIGRESCLISQPGEMLPRRSRTTVCAGSAEEAKCPRAPKLVVPTISAGEAARAHVGDFHAASGDRIGGGAYDEARSTDAVVWKPRLFSAAATAAAALALSPMRLRRNFLLLTLSDALCAAAGSKRP